MKNASVQVVNDVARAGAALFFEPALSSYHERGHFTVVLSGGSTPIDMDDILSRDHAHDDFWAHTYLFWGDERFVPHDHPDSNYGAAKERLVDKVAIPDANVIPWPYVDGDPEGACAAYARRVVDNTSNPPKFDLVFLGMGDDGHTASLFPGTGAVLEPGVAVVVEPEGKQTRLSLTAETLSRGRTVAFLVAGETKHGALQQTLAEAERPEPDLDRYPAVAISAREQLICFTDMLGF
jgi:6-phosphogluconolactonase